jgi:DNA-binding LytR/AlgR family response regulator
MFKGNYSIELENGLKIDLSRRQAKALKQIIDV